MLQPMQQNMQMDFNMNAYEQLQLLPLKQFHRCEDKNAHKLMSDDEIKKHTNKLKKMCANSLLIKGYLRQVKTNNFFEDIDETICYFYGCQSVYNAVCIQDVTICKYILANFLCDVNDVKHEMCHDDVNHTPLMKAVQIRNIELINILLQYNAHRTVIDEETFYLPNHPNPLFQQSKVESCSLNPISICIDELMDGNKTLNVCDKYIQIIDILLNHKISPNILSKKHAASLLHYGCKINDFEFVKKLVDEYHISVLLALKYDNNNQTAIGYIINNDDKIETFLKKKKKFSGGFSTTWIST